MKESHNPIKQSTIAKASIKFFYEAFPGFESVVTTFFTRISVEPKLPRLIFLIYDTDRDIEFHVKVEKQL